MEASCQWLLNTLRGGNAAALRTVLSKHRSRQENFDLVDLFRFMPDKTIANFAEALRAVLTPALAGIADPLEEEHTEHLAVVRAVSEVLWLLVQNRRQIIPPPLREIVVDLHGVLLALPEGIAQNQVAKICEWLFYSGDPDRERVVPQTMLYLLLRSFGDESMFVRSAGAKPLRVGGAVADVKRVYKMRDALDMLELSENVPDTDTIRTLLLRCATSPVYLRLDDGQKFLAHLLTYEEIRDAFFNALLNQLALVRKSRADFFGTVFLVAWKMEKSQWMTDMFMTLTEKALYAGTEPFATNLRTVLSAFHVNKRIMGVDELLNRTYGPVLYKNLMVANPFVRRNAVTIMAEAFPIHDPGAMMAEIETSIGYQCGKFLELLVDPSPLVRRSTVEGVCRVLGLLWELVPLATAKKMLEVITSKLAFDSSSAHVRIAVFEGIKFLLENHFTHGLLAVALPRMGCLIHDNVERVRLALLDLLVAIKSKRIVAMRYFDVVPVDELLLRLPNESPAIASRIMNLVISSYFPQEVKGKTADEIASSQVRACYSMLENNREASRYFYRHVNLYVSPGPLCEFALRLSAMAIDAPLKVAEKGGVRGARRRKTSKKLSTGRVRPKRPRGRVIHENEEPLDENVIQGESDASGDESSDGKYVDRNTLLDLVADVLVSVSPSLQKPANAELRDYVDDIFAGQALRPLLIPRGNNLQSRAACWRLASCISPSKLNPIVTLWREQLDEVLDWPASTGTQANAYGKLLSALIFCGIRWGKVAALSAVFSGWADGAISGHRTIRISAKARRTTRTSGVARRKSKSASAQSEADDPVFETRSKALLALRSAAVVLVEDCELREEFLRCIASGSSIADASAVEVSSENLLLVSELRKGCLGALDFVLENHGDDALPREAIPGRELLLQCLTATWKMILCVTSNTPDMKSVFAEFKEMLEWCSGDSLLGKAARVEDSFAFALSSICVAHCADAVGIGHLVGLDVLRVESFAKSLLNDLHSTDPRKVTRPVVELLRLSFQMREQFLYGSAAAADEKKEAKDPIVGKASLSILSTACRILSSCTVSDGRLTGQSVKATLLDGFLTDVLVAFCKTNEDDDEFQNTIGGLVQPVFESMDKAEKNLLASVVCNAVTTLATGPSRKSASARRLYGCIVLGMKGVTPKLEFLSSLANFSVFLAECLTSFYEKENLCPRPSAVEFVEVIETALDLEFAGGDHEQADGETAETLADARQTLASLRKLPEQKKAEEGQIERDHQFVDPVDQSQELSQEMTQDQSQPATQDE